MAQETKDEAQPATTLSAEQRQEIADKLSEAGVRATCPMCDAASWVLADGYFNEPIQGSLRHGLVIGGPSIPSVAIVCSNCGFMSRHAIGALGLLHEASEEDEE